MSVVALGSVKASPGVTTAAVMLAAAWPEGRDALVVEADPDGGVLAPRYGIGTDPGLVSAVAAARRGTPARELLGHAQHLPGGIAVLAGPASADQAHAALDATPGVFTALRELTDVDVLLDCGRISPQAPSLRAALEADLLLLVARPRLDEAHHVAHRVRALSGASTPIGLVTVGRRPYAPSEFADAVGAALVATLAHDPAAAEAVCSGRGNPRALRRSPLARSALEATAAIDGFLGSDANLDLVTAP